MSEHGLTGFHLAAYESDIEVLYNLANTNEVDINQRNSDKETPIHCAAKAGCVASVALLLEHGANPRLKDVHGFDAMTAAILGGNPRVLEVLRVHPRAGLSIHKSSGPGFTTLLMLAAAESQLAIVQYLLEKGEPVDAVNHNGATALFLACAHAGNSLIIEALLRSGADPNQPMPLGSSAVLRVASTGDVDAMRLLIAAGGSVTQPCEDGTTLLHVLARCSRTEMTVLALQHGAVAVVNSTNEQVCACCGGLTPLMMATEPKLVQALLGAGADVNLRTNRGATPLHVAAAHAYTAPVLCLLIKAGGDLAARNARGKTPAQVAADSGNRLAAALLSRAAK